MKKLINIISQAFRRRKQIATMICPSCGSQLVYRDCGAGNIWLGCTGCQKEY